MKDQDAMDLSEIQWPDYYPPVPKIEIVGTTFNEFEYNLRTKQGERHPKFEYRDETGKPIIEEYNPFGGVRAYTFFSICDQHKIEGCTDCLLEREFMPLQEGEEIGFRPLWQYKNGRGEEDSKGHANFVLRNTYLATFKSGECILNNFPDPVTWKSDVNQQLEELKNEYENAPYLDSHAIEDVTDYQSDEYRKSIAILHVMANRIGTTGRLNEAGTKRVLGHGTVELVTTDGLGENYQLQFSDTHEEEKARERIPFYPEPIEGDENYDRMDEF